ncbi:MAG: nucleoside hydrolase [Proteobacteria bacterium]|nr:nucleoside hydrolase [Pseudomonadota bacterium]
MYFAFTLPVAASGLPQGAARPVKVIFDTDMYGDIDDALALAMLHTLQDRGEAELLAVTISTETAWAAPYVDLINTFYGHPTIPIGITHGGVTEAALKNSRYGRYLPSPGGVNYTQYVAGLKHSDGSDVFPHRHADSLRPEDAVALIRKTLYQQSDGSVVIIGVGYNSNLAHLLESGPDAEIPLDGRSLVARKVKFLSAMAGNFMAIERGGVTYPAGSPEFNLEMDVAAAQRVFTQWPTPIVFSGSEIGARMRITQASVDRYFNYVARHPVAETYRYAASFYNSIVGRKSGGHDHPTYDLTSVLYAVRPDAAYFTLSGPGIVSAYEGGRSSFTTDAQGRHRFLLLSETQQARALEAMTLLVTEPPENPCKN